MKCLSDIYNSIGKGQTISFSKCKHTLECDIRPTDAQSVMNAMRTRLMRTFLEYIISVHIFEKVEFSCEN